MNKTNKILIAIAIVQVLVLSGVSLMGGASEPTQYDETPFVTLKTESISGIEISDDAGEILTLKKTGDHWVVTSAADYPADSARITPSAEATSGNEPLLSKLASLIVDRPSIRREENHLPLKVHAEEFERRLTLTTSEGKDFVGFIASGASPQTVYLRRDGENEVYEVSGLSTWDLSTSVDNWVDTTYQKAEMDAVVGLQVAFADAPGCKLVRREVVEAPEPKENEETSDATEKAEPEYKWWFTSPSKKEAKETEIDSLLRKLTSLRLKDVHGKDSPESLQNPTATWTLTMKDGSTLELQLGGKVSDDADDRFAKSSSSDFYAVIAGWNASGLIELDPKTLEVEEEKPDNVPEDPSPEKEIK